MEHIDCTGCKGTGWPGPKDEGKPCSTCDGTGKIILVDVDIYLIGGQVIHLKKMAGMEATWNNEGRITKLTWKHADIHTCPRLVGLSVNDVSAIVQLPVM